MLLMSDPPVLLFTPDALSAALIRLRTEAHLSQRTLAKLSDVSNTAISGLEAGTGAAPHPAMLLSLARGLATSGFGAIDEERAEAAYLTLMRAAGYVPEEPPAPVDDALLRTLIERRLGNRASANFIESIIVKLRGRTNIDFETALDVIDVLLRKPSTDH